MDSCHRGAGRSGPSGGREGATLILYQRRCGRHEPVMNMCHFTRRTLGGLAAQAWKIECLGLMILKMIESRLEMASPARPAEMETYLTAICPARPPPAPPYIAAQAHARTMRTQHLIPPAAPWDGTDGRYTCEQGQRAINKISAPN